MQTLDPSVHWDDNSECKICFSYKACCIFKNEKIVLATRLIKALKKYQRQGRKNFCDQNVHIVRCGSKNFF